MSVLFLLQNELSHSMPMLIAFSHAMTGIMTELLYIITDTMHCALYHYIPAPDGTPSLTT